MNNSIFESIFAVFDDKPPFLSILDTFWPIFGHFSYLTSINDPLTIELNYLLNWIGRIFFELNNILNWILGKAILNQILNESFFGKIQKMNWIRLGIGHHYGSGVSGLPLEVVHYSSRPVTRSCAFLYLRSGIIVRDYYLISQWQWQVYWWGESGSHAPMLQIFHGVTLTRRRVNALCRKCSNCS